MSGKKGSQRRGPAQEAASTTAVLQGGEVCSAVTPWRSTEAAGPTCRSASLHAAGGEQQFLSLCFLWTSEYTRIYT